MAIPLLLEAMGYVHVYVFHSIKPTENTKRGAVKVISINFILLGHAK